MRPDKNMNSHGTFQYHSYSSMSKYIKERNPFADALPEKYEDSFAQIDEFAKCHVHTGSYAQNLSLLIVNSHLYKFNKTIYIGSTIQIYSDNKGK